ncbi:MAG: transporter substrate-binding domain-containing protein [Deltaproteobacteria bacterium]|nr:transporter substrate-binding domain-containing protein [Deltaproteobacteria bacterium]
MQKPGIRTKRIVVTGNSNYSPYSFLDENGKPQGHDVEIMNALAAKLKIEVEYRLKPWDEAILNLRAGSVDALIGIVYLDERKEFYDFTIPVWLESYAIFARQDARFTDFDDLNRGTIVALRGDASIYQFIVPMKLSDRTRYMNTLVAAFQSIEEGTDDFVLAPYSIGMEIIGKFDYRGVKVVGPPILPSLYCIAVSKGNYELIEALNSAIDALKSDGTIERLNKKWFIQRRPEFSIAEAMKILAIVVGLVAVVISVLFAWSWSLRSQVQRKTAELAASEAHFKTLVSNIPGIVYRCANDAEWSMEYISDGVEQITGFHASDFLCGGPLNYAGIIHPEDRSPVDEAVQEGVCAQKSFTKEYRVIDRDGSIRWVYEKGQGVFSDGGNLLYLDGVILDITDRKKLQDELVLYATTDVMTGVFNRRFGLSLLEKHMSLARRTGNSLAICYVDIDNLKTINDQYGHEEGDTAILKIIDVLKTVVRESDIICRLGGDEFMVILPSTDSAGAEVIWQRVEDKIKQEKTSWRLLGSLSASHGVAELTRESKTTTEELISLADSRMYMEKQARKHLTA